MIALTFDDGPDPDWTPKVLDALKAVDARATFFVVAEQLEQDAGPNLLRRILDEKHAVQVHCGSHSSHQDLDLCELEEDAQRILAVLAANGVPTPCLWRPPYGHVNDELSCHVASERNLQMLLWTHNTHDYSGIPAEDMFRAAVQAPLYQDSVILMHDSRRYAQNKDGAHTVALIEPLVDFIRNQGWALDALTTPVGPRPQRQDEDLLLPCPSTGTDV